MVKTVAPYAGPDRAILYGAVKVFTNKGAMMFGPRPTTVGASVCTIGLLGRTSIRINKPSGVTYAMRRPALRADGVVVGRPTVRLVTTAKNPKIIATILSSKEEKVKTKTNGPPTLISRATSVHGTTRSVMGKYAFSGGLPYVTRGRVITMSSVTSRLVRCLMGRRKYCLTSGRRRSTLARMILTNKGLGEGYINHSTGALLKVVKIAIPSGVEYVAFRKPGRRPLVTARLVVPVLNVIETGSFSSTMRRTM